MSRARAMISFFGGSIILVGTLAAFWHLLPQDGVPHPLAVRPFLQVIVPITLVSGVVIGIGMVVSGLANLNSF